MISSASREREVAPDHEGWRNLDSAFPPFVPGAPLKSVYERAGFDVNKTNNTQSGYGPGSRAHSGQTSRSGSFAQSMRSSSDNMQHSSQKLRTSSAMSSNSRSQTPNPEFGTQQQTLNPIHSRDHSQESNTYYPAKQDYRLCPVPPPSLPNPPAHKPTPSVHEEYEANRPQSLEEYPPEDQIPTTPLMIAPPPKFQGQSNKSNSPKSSRNSNASSIYSAGYDPLYDLSPRYDRTKSLLPYQREMLELDDDIPPEMPSFNNNSLVDARVPNSSAYSDGPTGRGPAFLNISSPNKGNSPVYPPNHVTRSDSLASASSRDSSGPRTPNDLPLGAAAAVVIHQQGHEVSTVHTHTPPKTDLNVGRRRSKKGPCRGCGNTIIGKSVSASDGTLSGRWHRECFRCAGCDTQDFQRGNQHATSATAEFYILRDRPLCHQCYHEENNSMCPLCERGIEGACLDDGISRYHPACLKCADCQALLDPGYGFISVVNGVFYCPGHAEMHARAEVARTNSRGEQTKTTVVEKRRTQFLMMQ